VQPVTPSARTAAATPTFRIFDMTLFPLEAKWNVTTR
jgi:hypothetical protein